jgi:response regulator RpfG family c-di-GMP phosphodiesterase
LIVDDEPSYRDHLERFLVREGYDVRTASTGEEALTIGREFSPSVILADWMLKDHVHGLQVAKTLRDWRPDMQILLMTGFPSSVGDPQGSRPRQGVPVPREALRPRRGRSRDRRRRGLSRLFDQP